MAAKQKPCLQGVLFDWDGTLIDSYDADSSAYLAMFEEMGIAWGIEELEEHYSPNWYQVYRAAKLPRRLWKEADRPGRAHYANHQPKLISGARRVLEAIRTKHRLGLVTSGDRHRVARQLREFRLTRLFSARVWSGGTLKKKPHPAPLRLALRQMELQAACCVYAGGAPQDVEMARNAGRAPGVSYWFPQRTAGRAELAAQRPGIVVSGTRGRRRSGGRGSNLRSGGGGRYQ